jgi:hypothetical protein
MEPPLGAFKMNGFRAYTVDNVHKKLQRHMKNSRER